MAVLFDDKLNKYVGNLHMHTTVSDGNKTVEEALSLYADEGYDFVVVTDHFKYAEESNNGILKLSGAEYDSRSEDGLEVFHIVCAGAEHDPQISRQDDVQTTINKINDAGGIAILAHPHWSMQTIASILPLDGISAMEIYNSVSSLPMNCRPDSSYFSDLLSTRGKLLPCVADDDSHGYTFEACKSYIVVLAEELTRENILSAIKNGNFYATQGPDIHSVEINDGILSINCSKVSTAVFYDNLQWISDRSVNGENLTHFEHKILPEETFVRVELIDAQGNSAWLSPIKVN